MGGSLVDGCNVWFIVFLETVPGMIWVAGKRGTFCVYFPSILFSCGSVLWVQECLESFPNRSQQIPTSYIQGDDWHGGSQQMFGALECRMLLLEGNRCFCIIQEKTATKTTKTGEMVSLSPEIFVHSYHVPWFLGGKVEKSPCCQWWWWSFQIAQIADHLHNLDGPSRRPAIESPTGVSWKKTHAQQNIVQPLTFFLLPVIIWMLSLLFWRTLLQTRKIDFVDPCWCFLVKQVLRHVDVS